MQEVRLVRNARHKALGAIAVGTHKAPTRTVLAHAANEGLAVTVSVANVPDIARDRPQSEVESSPQRRGAQHGVHKARGAGPRGNGGIGQIGSHCDDDVSG